MIDSLRNTYHPSFSLFLSSFFSLSLSLLGFRVGFPSTCTRGRARPQAHVPRIRWSLGTATKYARSRVHEEGGGREGGAWYTINTKSLQPITSYWALPGPATRRSRVVAWKKKRVPESWSSRPRPSGLFRQFIDDPRYRRNAAALESSERSRSATNESGRRISGTRYSKRGFTPKRVSASPLKPRDIYFRSCARHFKLVFYDTRSYEVFVS